MLCFLLAVLSAGFWAWYHPVAFRQHLMRPVREVLFFKRELTPWVQWQDIERETLPRGLPVQLPGEAHDGLHLAADLYRPHQKGKTPAVLLLHGSSPWGRQNGLIRLLAIRLLNAGYTVLTPDARGFGESQDPFDVSNPDHWRTDDDTRRWLDYLATLDFVDPQQMYVVGHSRGAGHALEGALTDQRVRSLILLGPPRFVHGISTSFWRRVRWASVRDLDDPVPPEVIAGRGAVTDITAYAGISKNCVPLLVVDGARESLILRQFLAQAVDALAPSASYRTIKEAGHYFGVYNWFGSDTVYYRQSITDSLLDTILNHLKEGA